MHIYFSTNAIPAENWERIHEYLDEFEGEVGLEIFPEYQKGAAISGTAALFAARSLL